MQKIKYSKVICSALICLSILCSFSLVSAQETTAYYTNDNGVSLSNEEYKTLTKLYWDGYQKTMTREEYNKFVENDIMNREYAEKVFYDTPMTRGTFHSSLAKKIKISRSCDENNCFITTVLTWLGVPTIKSYDVMGCSFDGGLSTITPPATKVSSSDKTFFSNDLQTFSNGFGSSFKIPTGDNLIISQDFFVTRYGHVYASYQHAMRETTLEVSRDYVISGIGFGGVFGFSDRASKIYDDMNGVDIAV